MCVVLGLAACGTNGGGLRNDAYKLITEKKEEVVAYRDAFASRELMIIWPNFVAFNTTTAQTETVPAVAVAMGLRAKIDNETGWHKRSL